jgi:GH35 family endo-1,4-beta-xylanase
MTSQHKRPMRLLLTSLSAVLLAVTATLAAESPSGTANAPNSAPDSAPGVDQHGPTIKDAYKNHFLIGAAGDMPGNYSEQERDLVKENFNTVTPENCMKPALVHPSEDTWRFERPDALVQWCADNNIAIHGHTLVWHAQTNDWFFRDGDKATVTRRMKDHIRALVGRYKGKILSWDVVNEAINDGGNGQTAQTENLRNSQWLQVLGPEFLTLAFKFAHEADPDAKLYYNDYGIEAGPKHASSMVLLKRLIKDGAPIHGVGIQGHWSTNHIPYAELDKAISDYASLGLKVSITELDVTIRGTSGGQFGPGFGRRRSGGGAPPAPQDLQAQADAYARLFAIFIKHKDVVERVTFWGLSDRRTWRFGQHPLIFDSNNQRKPAYAAIVDALLAPTPDPAAAAEPAAPTPAATKAVPLTGPFKWKSSGILMKPVSDDAHKLVSVKDPTVVYDGDRWHVYATTANDQGNWSMVYLSFKDWSEAADAKPYYLDANPNLRGYHCAPHVFYFRPHKKWYLVFQSQQPQYSTTDDISKPETWSKPEDFFAGKPPGAPRLWIDYWVICDDTHAYLFFTGDDGNFYRSRTKIEDFPKGMSNPEIAIRETRETLFEGSMTYRIKGTGTYLTLIEALGPNRYYRAFTSDRLDGQWTPLPDADTYQKPFAGINNVTFEEGISAWTKDISHGELVRDGYDETMTLDPSNLQLLFQGRDPTIRTDYGLLPYRLGLLKLIPAGN